MAVASVKIHGLLVLAGAFTPDGVRDAPPSTRQGHGGS